MISNVSVSSPEDLRKSGQKYHGFIRDHYLDLPKNMPPRISNLAHELVLNESNPYDKAIAIENHLRNGDYVYSQKIPTPPVGTDGVDYFLFVSKKGYSDYFASAMTVMLRDLGIPSRLATGYSSGSYDSRKEISTIKDSDSHGWVQVFFPGYGWIDFEPTPNWERPSRNLREKTPSPYIRSDSIYKSGNYPKFPDDYYDEIGPEGESVTHNPKTLDLVTKKTVLIPFTLIFLLFLTLMFITMFWRYGLSGLSPTERVTIKIYRLARLTGLSKHNYQTMEEYSLVLSERYPTIKTDIRRITTAYMEEKYSALPHSATNLETSWAIIKTQILKDFLNRIFKWAQKNDTTRSN